MSRRAGPAVVGTAVLAALVLAVAAGTARREPEAPLGPVASARAAASGADATGASKERSRVEALLERARSLVINLVAVLAVCLVTVAILKDAWSGSYVIDPIAVPEEFAKSVEGSDAVAARIRDGVGTAWQRALSQYAVKPVVLDSQEPSLSVTGTSLPLRYLTETLRDLLGNPITRISGQLTMLEPPVAGAAPAVRRVRLTLRRSDGAAGPFFSADMPYVEAIGAAALKTLIEVDPFDGARVVSEAAPDEGVAIASAALARSREEEWPAWVQRGLASMSDVPRGELALANILLSMGRGRFDEARTHFELANAEFRRRDPGGRDWYAAQDGLATYYIDLADVPDEERAMEGMLGHNIEARRYTAAEAHAQAALALQPGYDSALYHVAQVFDRRSRSIFRDPACRGPASASRSCTAGQAPITS